MFIKKGQPLCMIYFYDLCDFTKHHLIRAYTLTYTHIALPVGLSLPVNVFIIYEYRNLFRTAYYTLADFVRLLNSHFTVYCARGDDGAAREIGIICICVCVCVYIQRPQNKTSKTVNNNIIIRLPPRGRKNFKHFSCRTRISL
jgi:hypothetical protein